MPAEAALRVPPGDLADGPPVAGLAASLPRQSAPSAAAELPLHAPARDWASPEDLADFLRAEQRKTEEKKGEKKKSLMMLKGNATIQNLKYLNTKCPIMIYLRGPEEMSHNVDISMDIFLFWYV